MSVLVTYSYLPVNYGRHYFFSGGFQMKPASIWKKKQTSQLGRYGVCSQDVFDLVEVVKA